MGREIERKFLVKGNDWKGVKPGVMVRQGYVSTHPERAVRVRVTGEEGFLAVKGAPEGIVRLEYEYEIPLEDAEEMLRTFCIGFLIEKIRHHREHEGMVWEIDEFLGVNEGLVVAEVELEREDQQIQKPEWVGEEVSGDPRYLNANLVHHPFSRWRNERT